MKIKSFFSNWKSTPWTKQLDVTINHSHRLSPNFTLGEVVKSQTADRFGIKNEPSPAEIDSLRALCRNVMEPVRSIKDRPVIVTSGFRCPRLNTKIGSWPGSQHTKAEAIDFEIHGISLHNLWRDIVLSDIPFDQCILEFPPNGWIHISHVTNGEQRGKITIAKRIHGNVKYIHLTKDDVMNFKYKV